MTIILAAFLISCALIFARSFMAGDLQSILNYIRKGIGASICLALIFLLFSGTLSALFIGLLAMIPLAPYLKSLKNNQPQNFTNPEGITPEKALAILGLPTDATPQQIKGAHKKLIQKVHPDKGGSTYLASTINQARDTLIKD